MSNSIEVSSVALANEVIGVASVAAMKAYTTATDTARKRAVSMACQLNSDGILSAYLRAPTKGMDDTAVTIHGKAHTHREVYEAMKFTLVGFRAKSDLALWKAPKGSLSTDRSERKVQLIKEIGSRMSTIALQLEEREAVLAHDAAQKAEDILAKKEGREPELLTREKKGAGKTRAIDVRIVDGINKVKNWAQNAEGEDLELLGDITEGVKHLDAALLAFARK